MGKNVNVEKGKKGFQKTQPKPVSPSPSSQDKMRCPRCGVMPSSPLSLQKHTAECIGDSDSMNSAASHYDEMYNHLHGNSLNESPSTAEENKTPLTHNMKKLFSRPRVTQNLKYFAASALIGAAGIVSGAPLVIAGGAVLIAAAAVSFVKGLRDEQKIMAAGEQKNQRVKENVYSIAAQEKETELFAYTATGQREYQWQKLAQHIEEAKEMSLANNSTLQDKINFNKMNAEDLYDNIQRVTEHYEFDKNNGPIIFNAYADEDAPGTLGVEMILRREPGESHKKSEIVIFNWVPGNEKETLTSSYSRPLVLYP